jgi:hypothetical protein
VDVLQLDIRGVNQARGDKDSRVLQKCTLDNMAILFNILEVDEPEPATTDTDIDPNANEVMPSVPIPEPDEDETEAEMQKLSKRERRRRQGDRLKHVPKNIYVKVVQVSGDLDRCWLDFSNGERVDAPVASEHPALQVRKK